MKKFLSVMCAALMLAGCVSCGESKSGGGTKYNKSPESAAKAYIKSRAEGDTDVMFKLVPTEALEYLENESYLTDNQLREKYTEYMNGHTVSISNIEVVEKRDRDDDMSMINEDNEKYYNLGKSEKAYNVTCSFDLDDEKDHSYELSVFEYNGDWYVWDAMHNIRIVAEKK